MGRPRLLVAGLVTLVVLLAAGAAVAGYAITAHLRAKPKPKPPPPTPSAVRAAGRPAPPASTPPTAPLPVAASVAATLAPALGAAGLGPRVRADVLDVATGTSLLDRSATAPTTPASTAKLLTAAAVLRTRGAGYRITTTVVRGRGGSVVLVGAGDPTLSGAAAGQAPAYTEAARLSDLAAAIRRAGVRPTRIVVDDSLFTGPTVSPKWAPEDVPSDYASPITPVMVDGGRDTPTSYVRSRSPDLAAGRRLATALGEPGLPVSRGTAPAGAGVVASVRSAPVSELVAQMLQGSDNVIAECLARQVALAQRRPADFAGAAAAVRDVVRGLGVDPGAGLVDGSGLAATDHLSAAVLAELLRVVARTPALRYVVAGLPVADWSGTLADRYTTGSSRAAAGVVRAKTGTLTGVSALAGLLRDRSGRLLAFAFVADRTGDTVAAETALDVVAARLASCGCTS